MNGKILKVENGHMKLMLEISFKKIIHLMKEVLNF